MKLPIFLLFLLTGATSLLSQQLETSHIGASGSELKGSSGSIHFNLGEVAINQSSQLQEGVIQLIKVSTLIENNFDASRFQIYPNPTSGPLHIKQEGEIILNWILSDVHGHIVHQYEMKLNEENFDISQYPPGTYYVIPVKKEQYLTAIALQIIQ